MKYGKFELGQVEALLNKVDGYDGANALLSDKAWIMYDNPIINLNKKPKLPIRDLDGRYGSVRSNQKQGVQTIDLANLKFHSFKAGEVKTVGEAILALSTLGKKGYNAVLLDFLIENPYMFFNKGQEKLRKQVMYAQLIFPATTYLGDSSPTSACVRTLFVGENQFGYKLQTKKLDEIVYETDYFVIHNDSKLN
jgi:hypothetical protein